MSVHDAAAWYSMFVCMVFDTFSRCCLCWQCCGVRYSGYYRCSLYCSTLESGLLNTARTGSMSSTSNEGPNIVSTGSMMSSTEHRVQSVPAEQTPSETPSTISTRRTNTIRNGWSAQNIKSVEPVDISSARSIYSRNTSSTLSTRVPPRSFHKLPFVGPSVNSECCLQ